jgi:hypothetical protein
MTPFQILIGRHVDWTLRVPALAEGLLAPSAGDKAAISFAKVLAYV